MTADPFGTPTVLAPVGMVVTAEHLASSSGVAMLRAGGTAVDAAVAAGAVLAVTNQNMCGLGGDLFALVHPPGEAPVALCAGGRAGSGADAMAMRVEGLDQVPRRGDIRAVTVPGCVDGWITLHRRFGRLPLSQVLEPARTYAGAGFPASPLLARSAGLILDVPGADEYHDPAMAAGGRLPEGTLIRRPGAAAALDAIANQGRAGFYHGVFGEGLIRLGRGLFDHDDLARNQAEWVEPLHLSAWGHDVWAPPPPSQGYLTLAGAWVADGLDLPDDPADPAWAHLLSEAARHVGADRPSVLYDGADGAALIDPDRLGGQRAAVDPERRSPVAPMATPGGTTVCCTVDRDRMGVTLVLSNAWGWGAHIVEPATGIFLHDRGLGFSLEAGHPAELAPGRRPPHTLSPALVTRPDGSLRAVVGTMGGDSQPQVLLQVLARLLRHGQAPGEALDAGRWVLAPARPGSGFDTWAGGDGPGAIALESHASEAWDEGLTGRGHTVERRTDPIDHGFGHAQVIAVSEDGLLQGAADPRAVVGAASGW